MDTKKATDSEKDRFSLISDIKQEFSNIRGVLDQLESDMDDNDDEGVQKKAVILSIGFINSLESFPHITNDIIKSLKEIENGH